MKKKGSGYYLAKAIPAILLLLLLFIVPIAFIFSYAFQDGAASILDVVEDDYTYHLLSFTLQESLLSAFISVIAALPFAAFFSRYTFPGRKMLLTVSQLSFTIPTILVVLGFVIWYGNNGYLNNALRSILGVSYTPLSILYSFKAIILAHVYLNFPIAFTLITASWTTLSETEENAAYTLGQSNESPIFIKSSRIEFYSKDNRATTEALSFVQYNDDGNVRLEGSADKSVIDTESKRMELEGNVKLSENDSGMMIEADTLIFDSENEEITADGHVRVVSEDGEFEGTGFAGDLMTSSYSFASIEKGVFKL